PTRLPLWSGSPAPPPRRARSPAGGSNPSRRPATRSVAHTAYRTLRRTRPPDPAPTPRSRPDSPARTPARLERGRGRVTEVLAYGVSPFSAVSGYGIHVYSTSPGDTVRSMVCP